MYAKPHPPTQTVCTAVELLQELEAAARRYFRRGRRPVACLDLDGTLLDGNLRTIRILYEYLSYLGLGESPLLVAGQLTSKDLGYGPETALDALTRRGVILSKDASNKFRQYWQERFFTDSYQDYDRTEDGGPEFARRLVEYGIEVVYLTGRDRANMFGGVVRNLEKRGFPVGTPTTRLVLKPTWDMNDLEFKHGALSELGRSGIVIGVVDNEPGICNMAHLHPKAPVPVVAWFDSPHAPSPPQLHAGVRVLQSFVLG